MLDSELKEQKITVAQTIALHRVFSRCPLYVTQVDGEFRPDLGPTSRETPHAPQITFEEFAKTIKVGTECVMVKWCGMWLGIEADGYTHS